MRVPHGGRARGARATSPRPPSNPLSWIALPARVESMNRGCVRERRAMIPLLCQGRSRPAEPRGWTHEPRTSRARSGHPLSLLFCAFGPLTFFAFPCALGPLTTFSRGWLPAPDELRDEGIPGAHLRVRLFALAEKLRHAREI